MKKAKLIVVSAPSGSGKTSVVKEILKSEPKDLAFSISATTRKKRESEVNGREYFFLTVDEFKSKIENGEFVEWECIYGDYYGTLKSEINRLLNEGKNILLELDVMGSLTLKKKFPDAKLIFIVPPSIEVLEERLRKRNTETEETLARRMERAKMELEKAKYFDYEVKNYNLEEAVEEVKKIIEDIISNEGE